MASIRSFQDMAWDVVNRLTQLTGKVPSALTNYFSSLGQALFNASPTARTEGQVGPLQADSLGSLNVTLATKIAGEDTTNDTLKVEEQFTYQGITLAAPTTTVVKSGQGLLHCITFNKPTATGTVTIYDNTAGSGTVIGTITVPSSPQPCSVFYDVKFSTGLTIVTATAASDITVCYR